MSSQLDRIRIASPCPITWEQMVGDDSVRFCNHCRLNVYNLSSLNIADAEALVASTEGRLCARLYSRSDGTVLTKDCPVGLQALRRRIVRTAAAVFALLGSFTAVSGQTVKSKKDCTARTRITHQKIVSSSGETILTGQVLDPMGAVIAGATVALRNLKTKETQKMISSEEGRFQFVGMATGEYSIQIESPGFSKHRIKDFKISNNEVTNLEITLSVKPAELPVLVGVVGASPNDPPGTTTISEKLLRSLPH